MLKIEKILNFKQEELINQLMDEIRERFPGIEYCDVTESPDGPNTLWIIVTSPDNEETMMELTDFAGDRLTDIFMEYGYHMLLMPIRDKAA